MYHYPLKQIMTNAWWGAWLTDMKVLEGIKYSVKFEPSGFRLITIIASL